MADFTRSGSQKKLSSKTGDGGHPLRRRGRAWWRGGDGGRSPGRGPGDAECQRVSHFCGAVARARAAQAAARAHAAGRDGALGGRHWACPCSLHRQRRAPILGSPCSPDFSGAFSRTGGARACAPRPWRVLACGGAAVSFSRTSAAAAGGTAQLPAGKNPPKLRNFAPCGVGGRWHARGGHAALRGADRLCSCLCSDFGAEKWGGARGDSPAVGGGPRAGSQGSLGVGVSLSRDEFVSPLPLPSHVHTLPHVCPVNMYQSQQYFAQGLAGWHTYGMPQYAPQFQYPQQSWNFDGAAQQMKRKSSVPAKQATRPAVAAAAPSAASASRALPADKPPLTPKIPQERTEVRSLRERVRALEQLLASAATEAPGEGTSNRSRWKGGKAHAELASAAVAASATTDSASVGFLQVKSFHTFVAAQSSERLCQMSALFILVSSERIIQSSERIIQSSACQHHVCPAPLVRVQGLGLSSCAVGDVKGGVSRRPSRATR
jgi:hypothetical protein